ncbi:MAG TPA: methylated-DNA--[protein]-cysteine S-methyltransferase [Opitutales bacterium]|nr:methylated-DNA--[protein]-cysteine S-methyltransferase [Opitutales bacterium]
MRFSPPRLPRFRTLAIDGADIHEIEGPPTPKPPFGWGLCEFDSTGAYAVWDGIGLMALEVGFRSQRESACAAMNTLRNFGCDCSMSFFSSDDGASEYLRLAMEGGEIRLHVAVSDFQLSVYRMAAAIVPGTTLTYGQIAARLGHPRSARAVARALAANKAALAIPCHRVVPAAGGAGGWRWGRHLKETVLTAEADGHLEKLLSE